MQESSPEQYNPPLTWRGHLWRSLLVLAISTMVAFSTAPIQLLRRPSLFWVDLVVGLAAFVLSFYRRRWPFAVALALAAMSTVSGIASGPGTLASVSLATRRRLWQVVLVGAAAVLAAELFWFTQPQPTDDPWWVYFAVGVAFTIATMVWGMYVGSRRELLWTLRDRAERAEAEQGLRLERARSNERARIAREMHDVLAHRISLVSMHAGALAYRSDLTQGQVRETAELIQTKSHEALTDLRQVLGVLRGEGRDFQERPQPRFTDLPALVCEAEQSGMSVRFTDQVRDGSTVPEPVGRTTYRIVQEGLTNARKHAPGVPVSVRVDGAPETGISIRVRNPVRPTAATATPGAGLGLVGLAERAMLAGGRLDTVRDEDAFELRGWLPWLT